jgi:membrane protein DedA with SNARE-associated domain
VYALIALSCVTENFFPPSPSDVFVAMAAFLSHRGAYEPTAIFFTALAGGLAGAAAVYGLARRHADRFGQSRLGRKLLPPAAAAFFLKEYGRYGALGMFITRLLPGFRSVVAPFAGLTGLGPVRTMIPIAAAVVLWYGTLTWIGARLGREWEQIRTLLDGINAVLAWAAAVLIALAVAVVVHRRRARRRRGTLP